MKPYEINCPKCNGRIGAQINKNTTITYSCFACGWKEIHVSDGATGEDRKKIMKPNEMILGIDFGETVESKNAEGVKVENPRAMEVVARCVKECKAVYIISKVNPKQLFEVAEWCWNHGLFEITNLPIENIRFTGSRAGKGPIAKELGITHMIDDRPEVMAYLPKRIEKILFKPIIEDVAKWQEDKTPIAQSWTDVERMLFGG